MKTQSLRLAFAALAASAVSLSSLQAQLVEAEELIPSGSTWEYLLHAPDDGGGVFTPVDPTIVDPDFYTTWQLGGVGYDGPAFGNGLAPLGYGTINGDATVTNIWEARDGNDAPPSGFRNSAYFRTTVTPTADATALRFTGIIDDGAVIYVDGIEVVRTANVPAGNNDTWDLLTDATGSETTAVTLEVTGLTITNGVDLVISVSVHSAAVNSSDMGMNFRVAALEVPGPTPPDNDDFFDAEILSGTLPITATGRLHDNDGGAGQPHGVGATFEAEEPVHANDLGVGSIWYGYVATADGRLAVSTGGSSFDAIVAVYTGGDLDELVELDSSTSDILFYPGATALFDVIEGNQYWIAVDGRTNGGAPVENENYGDVTLTIRSTPEPIFTEILKQLSAGSDWSYLLVAEDDAVDPLLTNQPVDPELAGAGDPDFDTTWQTAAGYDGPAFSGPSPAPLGYGVIDADPIVTDIWGARDIDADPDTEDLLPPSGQRYAAYFRTTFTPAAAIPHLGFRGLIDDGATIYINGVEVSSINFAGDPDDWQAFALTATDTELAPQEGVALNVNLPAGQPVEIAVVVRNPNATSSDMAFDLEVYSIQQPVIDFGQDFAANGPFRVSFESAFVGEIDGLGNGGEDDNLPWSASQASVQDDLGLGIPNPPAGANNSVHVNNGAIEIVSGRVDLQNVDNSEVFAAIDIRTFEDSDGSDFEAVDRIEAFIEGTTDGFSFFRVATILPNRIGGTPDNLKPLELAGGAYTTFNSTPGTIPANIRSIRVVVSALNNSNSEHFFVDNIAVGSGLPPTAPFIATITPNFVTGDNQIDFEGDGESLYQLRYSTDLLNWAEVDSEVGVSTFTHTPPISDEHGFYQVRRLDD